MVAIERACMWGSGKTGTSLPFTKAWAKPAAYPKQSGYTAEKDVYWLPVIHLKGQGSRQEMQATGTCIGEHKLFLVYVRCK